MKSNFSRPFRFHSWISPNLNQKKVTETKVEKIPNGTLTPHDFMGLQQSLCNINYSFGIFMSKYQRKNLLKCTTVITGSVKVVGFDGLFLTAIFTKKTWFLAKTTIPEKFYIFWEWDEQKKMQLSLTGFDTRKKRFHLVSNFFRAQLYLTKVSPIESWNLAHKKRNGSFDIIKWP